MNSVLNQSYSNFEVWIIDDASPEIIASFSDSRIHIIRNSKNLGPGPSRNIGMENSEGNFIAFLDSDDYWDTDFLKITRNALIENKKAGMAYANGFEVNIDGSRQIRRGKIKKLNQILPEILSVNRHWGTGGCLWRKSEIGNIRWIDSRTWEDYAFDIDVAIQNNSIVGLKEQVVYYDISGDDKLSIQNSELEKVISINHISHALLNSKFKKEAIVRESISYVVLMEIMRSRFSKKGKSKIVVYGEIFNQWNGIFMKTILWIILSLPENSQRQFLDFLTRLYRKRIRN